MSQTDEESESVVFEQHLASEVLKSEQKRVLILGSTFLVLLALAVTMPLLMSSMARATSGAGGEIRYTMIGFLAAVPLYELIMWLVLKRARRASTRFLIGTQYLNTLVEVSIPTVGILALSTRSSLLQALSAPPVFLYFFIIFLCVLRLNSTLCLFSGGLAAMQYTLLNVLAATNADPEAVAELVTPASYIGKPLLMLLAGVAAGFVTRQIKREVVSSIGALEEHNRVLRIFGQHVSEAVVNELVHRTEGMQSELRRVCVLFLDIRGFTTFSETRSPAEVVEYLNQVFDFMIRIVNDNGGIVNKFLGDGFMALFGAPIAYTGTDSARAVRAALAIRDAVNQANREGRIPETRIGIGIHVGEAVTGNVGSLRRKEYSIIGDVVNLASRVESLNKQLNSEILITQAVHDELEDGSVKAEPLGSVTVKGRNEPVQIFRLA